jgi:hypothetical protein
MPSKQWFIPPPNKPVEIRIIEPADPPFPHVRFARELDRRWGGYFVVGTTRPVGAIHRIVAGSY